MEMIRIYGQVGVCVCGEGGEEGCTCLEMILIYGRVGVCVCVCVYGGEGSIFVSV